MLMHLLSQHLKMTFYYYFNFTLGMDKQVDGGPKYSLDLGVQDKTDPSQHSMCCNHSSPNLLQLQLIKPQNLVPNTETIRNI